jgi:hypothetical protein
VLCGRGGGINKHHGNVIYRRVVEYNKKVYRQVPKRHRMLVSRSIVQAILNIGGRFLQEHKVPTQKKRNSNDDDDPSLDTNVVSRWTEIQLRRAVQKTSQALRERSCVDDSTTAAKANRDGFSFSECDNGDDSYNDNTLSDTIGNNTPTI